MFKAIILLALVATVNTVPIPHLDLQNPQVLSAPKSAFESKLQERYLPLPSDAARSPQAPPVWQQLPPTSTLAPQVTMWQQLSSTSALAPQTTRTDVPPPSAIPPPVFPLTTLPYIGPGIMIIPESSFVPGLGAFATPAPTALLPEGSDSPSRTGVHSVVAIGGTLAALIFLTVCFCFLSDPRVWRSCRHGISSRKRARFAQDLEPQRKTLPSWMKPKSNYPFSAKLMPILSQKRKPRGTPSEYGEGGDYNTSTSSGSIPSSSFSAPDLSRHKSVCLSVQGAPPSNGMTGRGDQAPLRAPPGAPIRPPRPPLADSPAEIKPIYYADLDDREFYRYPTVPLISNPPSMTGIGARSTLLPRAYPLSLPKPLDTNVPKQHARSRSAPGLDVSSDWTLNGVKTPGNDWIKTGQINSQTRSEE